MTAPLLLKGKIFGRLTCIKDTGKSLRGSRLWLCKCECGNTTNVSARNLSSGNTKSCGCLIHDILVKRNTTHFLCRDKNGKDNKLYGVWCAMKQRCSNVNNPDYKDYGGRGITVCHEWHDFKNFHDWALKNNYSDNLSIDRKNSNGNYEPSNCRWVTSLVQARNKRNNHKETYKGETKTLAEWAGILGIESSLLRYRLKHWGTDKAFSTPVKLLKNRRQNK